MQEFDVVKLRSELHEMPELGFKEFKTSDYIADKLTSLGIEVTRGIAGTGVVGTIKGTEPGPVLMLRADMDALPFGNPDGTVEVIHACGHDGHTAMLLTAASRLVGKIKRGTLKLFFQPAEETLIGSLKAIEDGVLDDVDIALGLHVRPLQDTPAGTCCAAVRHTSSSFIQIEIKGRSSHGSRPHLGVNCAEAAALVTMAVASLKFDPQKAWSSKVTSIVATAAAPNIIPDRAVLKVDVRTQTTEMMQELIEKLKTAAGCAAASVGAEAEVTLPSGYLPAALYDEDLVEEVRQSILEVIGPDKLSPDCGGGGEDFHYFKFKKPSIKCAYFGVGAGCAPGLHSRDMHFDPKYLENGVKVLVDMTLKKLG